ncbi:MAG: hypothetical protein QM757_06245, partial [Paludibaculum sp.]
MPEFRDVAEAAGLAHVFPNGGMQTKEFIIETTGSGVAFLDYDNDGLPDAFVISGEGALSRLYHNEGLRPILRRDREDGPQPKGLGTGRLCRRLR